MSWLGRGLCAWLVLMVLLPARASGESPFLEADRTFNRGDLPRAMALYEACARGARSEQRPLDLARALEGLAAIHLSTGQDADFAAAIREATSARRSFAPPLPASATAELAAEGGFERGLIPPWGTGHYESGVLNVVGIWWNSGGGRSFAKIDSAVARSGTSSLRITNFTPAAPHVFGTTAQRIGGVEPNALYEVSLWARAENLSPGAVQLIMDASWHRRPLALPAGTYDWTFFKAQFNSGDLSLIDLRILMQNTGTVWLDDLSLRRMGEEETPADPLVTVDNLIDRGRVRQALEHCRELEKTWAAEPTRLDGVWLRKAQALAAMGEYGEAMVLYEKVRTPHSHRVWMAMGDIYLNLGQPERALEQFRHVYETAVHDQASRALAADRMAMAHLRLGAFGEALAWEGVSLQIMAHMNDRHGLAQDLCHLGQIHLAAGQAQAARECFERALGPAQASGDRKLESDIMTQRAVLEGQQNDFPRALADLAEAIRLRREIFDRYGLIFSLFWQGRFQALQGDRQAARASLLEAVELLESVKHGAGSIERGGETLLKSSAEVYEELLRLDVLEGRTEQALEVAARQRGQELRRLFEGQGATLTDKHHQAYEKGRALLGEGEALEGRLQRALSQPAPDLAAVEEARGEREKRLSEYRQFLRDLFQTHPELAGLISVHPKQLRLKQSTLPPDAAIVEYLCGQDQLYIFLVTPRVLEVRIAQLSREDLTRRIGSLRRRILAGAQTRREDADLLKESNQLYRDLLGPVETDLQEVRKLAILPNGPLHYLPFQALVTDLERREFLVDRMACVNLCEESFLSPAAGSGAPRRMLLLGNPDGSLTHAEEEVRKIAALLPGSQTFLGQTARKELVRSAARNFEGLHIASHGELDRRDVGRSYILLAPDEADPQNGRLTLREVWGLDLKGIELVTLSACLTGLGETNPGDDLISLENAFFFAGASSVVASLWAVDDASTARLMTEFYRGLSSESRASSLRQAQLAVKAEHPHPYFWAPFILVGPSH